MSMAISDQVFAGGAARTITFVTGNPATAAANEIVAAVAGTKYRVLAVYMHGTGGANTCTWKSAATAISGAIDLLSDTPVVLPFSPVGWFQTAAAEALNLTLSAATAVAVNVVYIAIV